MDLILEVMLMNYLNDDEIQRNFFSQRVIDHWNSLPQEMIVDGFKRMLNKHLDPVCKPEASYQSTGSRLSSPNDLQP